VPIRSDEFNAGALDTGTWATEDPIGSTTFSVTGTQVSMAFSSGASGDRDMYTTGANASRIVQTVGDIQTFDIQAKFDTVLSANYQITGFAFWESTTRFLRADNYWSGSPQRYFSDITVGGAENLKDNGAALVTSGSASRYLRMQRSGTTWTWSESSDGVSWTQRFSGSITFTLLKWGLTTGAGNPGSGYPANTGLVDWVRVRQPNPNQLIQSAVDRSFSW
jgi:hypothetical protein